MNESTRLQDLAQYKVLSAQPEEELTDLTEIAAAVCETPIALISLIDKKRLWFRARFGIKDLEVPTEHSFSRLALEDPDKPVVIENALQDPHARSNPFVTQYPYITSFAGAPLLSRQGNVLGTLCVIDRRSRKFSDQQLRALKLLAHRTMSCLENQKQNREQGLKIASSASRLLRITDKAPGVIFEMQVAPENKVHFSFVSRGISELHPDLTPDKLLENPLYLYELIHPEDIDRVRKYFTQRVKNREEWNIEYRVIAPNGEEKWHRATAHGEPKDDGTVTWYGSIRDITSRKEYVSSLEKMVYDISHVMRRPLTTMLGLAQLWEDEHLHPADKAEVMNYVKNVFTELEEYTRKITHEYEELRQKAREQ